MKKILWILSTCAVFIPILVIAQTTVPWVREGEEYIHPLYITDEVRAPFYTATSTTATSTFANDVNISHQLNIGTPDPMIVHGLPVVAQVQLNNDDGNGAILELHQHTDGAAQAPISYGARSRGTTASPTAVQSGDALFYDSIALGYDGTDYEPAGFTAWSVGGVSGNNDMPGRYGIYTTADGAFSSTERFNILSNGNVGIGTPIPLVNLHITGTNANGSGILVNANGGGGAGDLARIELQTNVDAIIAAFPDSHANFPKSVGFVSDDLSAVDGGRMVFATGALTDFTWGHYGTGSYIEQMQLDGSTGNLGIGTTSPYAKLSVVGEVVASHFTGTTTATSTLNGDLDISSGHCYAVNDVCLDRDIRRLEYFGDGSDGSATLDAATSYTDWSTRSGGTYTLIRSVYLDTLTINSNATITPAGFNIYVKNTTTNNGYIDRSGNDGKSASSSTGGSAGGACSTGSSVDLSAAASASSAGANGGTAGGGVSSGVTVATYGGGNTSTAGNGGDGSGGTGGSGGGIAGAQLLKRLHALHQILSHTTVAHLGGVSGRGGGGGGGDGTAGGGGGGGGSAGCPIALYSRIVVNNGVISSNGGHGGNGFTAPAGNRGGGGGGSGGGGGFVYVVTESYSGTGSVTVTGGTMGLKGLGSGTGTNGTDGSTGSDGFKILFNLTTASSTSVF